MMPASLRGDRVTKTRHIVMKSGFILKYTYMLYIIGNVAFESA